MQMLFMGINPRMHVSGLDKFKAKKTRVLVATDIASRGIDVHKISHVINYDIPKNPKLIYTGSEEQEEQDLAELL
jgi:superfamily II DNA/RNA helicase